jgi:glutamate/aspartate transport system substrate-binding protein
MKFSTTRTSLLLFLTVASIAVAATVEAASPTLDKIKATGKITLGYRESSIPFSYLGGEQKPVGLSMDLCAAVVEKVKAELKTPGLEVAYTPVNPSNRIPLLQNGTIDIECGSTTNSADRQKQVAFSVATFVTSPRWLVMASSGISDVKGLQGRTVVFTQASLNFPIGTKVIATENLGATVVQAKDHAESLFMLRTGRASGWFEDDILEAGLVASSPDPKAYRVLPDTYALAYYGLMLRKDDAEFKALVDGVLKAKMASGEFNELYAKWLTSPISPNGQNLSLPMSEAMKARVASPSDAIAP